MLETGQRFGRRKDISKRHSGEDCQREKQGRYKLGAESVPTS